MNLPIQCAEQPDGTWEIAGTEYPEFFKCSHVASGLTKDDAEAFCFLANTYGHA